MEIITTSQNSNTHAQLALARGPGVQNGDELDSDIMIKKWTLGLTQPQKLAQEKGKESFSSKIAELEKEKEAALSKITQLEREGGTALTLLEREGKAAFSKIAVLETEKQAASIKIEELEKEKEDAARKITLLEKELETKEEKFGKHMNTQLQKEEEIGTKFEDFERHINAEHKKEKGAAICKITALEKELETKEVRAYKQAVRALREIQEEDKEPKEKVKELTITVQKLTEERQYWEALAKKLKGKESEAAELVEARKEMNRVWVFGHFYEAYVLQLCLTHCSFKAAN
ncbi:hypothetical protein BC332_04623 [Capsicum chinense]|nr:hypothetical protein BC332_04623 [Capsicum chinense]